MNIFQKLFIRHLEKKGPEIMGLKFGLVVNEVYVSLTDGKDTYYAKVVVNGNQISLTNFERA